MSRQEEYDKRAKHAGKGLSTRFSDNAFWLPHDIDEALIEALVALDRSGGTNKKPLIELLRSRGYVYLADLLDRYQLKRKQGGRQTPLYDRTDIHRRLMMAKYDMDHGKSLQQAADDWRLSPKALDEYRHGKRGSERRMARRRP